MPKIVIIPEKCKGCELCVGVCPRKMLRPSDEVNTKGVHFIVSDRPSDCNGCGLCFLVCPDVAIEIEE